LRIGGLTPMTSLDYPGELAAVAFCQGCPWRCRYCHNGLLLSASRPPTIPWREIESLLARRNGLLDAVVFSGGEPTLQGSLAAAMERTKALGFKVGLHTAGCYPERLRRLLPFVDWVGLDIKATPRRYPEITGVPDSGRRAWTSLGLLLESGTSLEVRTTLMPHWRLSEDLEPLARRIAQAGVTSYVVQTCRTAETLDPGLLPWTTRGGLSRESLLRLGNGLFPRFAVR
jgi:pyruvate formate lyase activating enzyme